MFQHKIYRFFANWKKDHRNVVMILISNQTIQHSFYFFVGIQSPFFLFSNIQNMRVNPL